MFEPVAGRERVARINDEPEATNDADQSDEREDQPMKKASPEVEPPRIEEARDTPLVFVVDDDVSVRESLEHLIRSAGLAVEAFASAREFLDRPRVHRPSCLLLDVTLPDFSGFDVQKLISAERTDLPIIFITGHGDVPMSVRAMKAGAAEFLTKPLDGDIVLDAIHDALAQSRAALGGQAEMRTLRSYYSSLSEREREVLALVVSGLLNKQVGSELGISEITVKAHRGRVMRKMHADSFADLVHIAARLGIEQASKG
jgi:FixJ family two-component response regulator